MECTFITTKAVQQRLPPDQFRFAPLSNRRSMLACLFSVGVFCGWRSGAGEAMLARGAHGSLGVFFSFLLPTLAALVMSLAMWQGQVFSNASSIVGILGNALMIVYVVLVTFMSSVQNMAMALAMPGGLLLMAWMVMFTIRLFRLSKSTVGG